jgi:hypothetical protein
MIRCSNITFLDELNQVYRVDDMTCVIVWDNVRFHHAQMVQAWFQAQPQFTTLYLPPYSTFLNTIEDFFSTWRWKVYDRRPHEQATLLQAMDIYVIGWMTHAMTSPCPEDSSQDVWLMKTSIVMWMRTCGQIHKAELMEI